MRDQGRKIAAELLTEAQFEELCDECDDLRKKAGADPLFNSWQWSSSWWRAFGRSCGLKLVVIACRNERQELIGVLPITIRDAKRRSLQLRRGELLGNLSGGPATVRSEYIEPIVDDAMVEDVSEALVAELMKLALDEIIFADTPSDSKTVKGLIRCLPRNWYCRPIPEKETDLAAVIRLEQGWEEFLRSLGKNTRLRIFGRRKFLEARHRVSVEYCQRNVSEYIDQLIRLHHVRWGGTLFEGPQRRFHEELCEIYARKGKLRLSRLIIDDKVKSVLYCIEESGCVYNLQLGFDDTIYPGKVSLGYLHLGYEIENAANNACATFDLLAGPGKNTDYKLGLNVETKRLKTWHIVTPGWKAVLYRIRDKLSV